MVTSKIINSKRESVGHVQQPKSKTGLLVQTEEFKICIDSSTGQICIGTLYLHQLEDEMNTHTTCIIPDNNHSSDERTP